MRTKCRVIVCWRWLCFQDICITRWWRVSVKGGRLCYRIIILHSLITLLCGVFVLRVFQMVYVESFCKVVIKVSCLDRRWGSGQMCYRIIILMRLITLLSESLCFRGYLYNTLMKGLSEGFRGRVSGKGFGEGSRWRVSVKGLGGKGVAYGGDCVIGLLFYIVW